jgi:hypothetical protein
MEGLYALRGRIAMEALFRGRFGPDLSLSYAKTAGAEKKGDTPCTINADGALCIPTPGIDDCIMPTIMGLMSAGNHKWLLVDCPDWKHQKYSTYSLASVQSNILRIAALCKQNKLNVVKPSPQTGDLFQQKVKALINYHRCNQNQRSYLTKIEELLVFGGKKTPKGLLGLVGLSRGLNSVLVPLMENLIRILSKDAPHPEIGSGVLKKVRDFVANDTRPGKKGGKDVLKEINPLNVSGIRYLSQRERIDNNGLLLNRLWAEQEKKLSLSADLISKVDLDEIKKLHWKLNSVYYAIRRSARQRFIAIQKHLKSQSISSDRKTENMIEEILDSDSFTGARSLRSYNAYHLESTYNLDDSYSILLDAWTKMHSTEEVKLPGPQALR